jgi:endonuclease/exonuclease/phosphatase family metal-dependent hydrolase
MRARLLSLAAPALLAAGLLAPATPPAASAADGGYLNLELSNTRDGRILVDWDRAAGSKVTHYVVETATARNMRTDLRRSDRVEPGTTELVVDPSTAVTPASGDYTFVKVRVYRSTGNGETRTKWIMPTPVEPPATGPRVRLASFNVKIWRAREGQKPWMSWASRRDHVVRTIVGSGAGVILVQEASGAAKLRVAGKRWQFQDLVRRLPDRFRLTDGRLYTHRGDLTGSQGSRIIYDASLYSRVSVGYLKMPAVSLRHTRWVPWALLRSRSTGEEFYVLSTHFKSGDDKPGSTAVFDLRQKQAKYIVDQTAPLAATGRSVFVGGDFNSTSNTLPHNGVHRTLVLAGFYDGFASRNITNGEYPTTTHGFSFPVRPGAYRRDYLMGLNTPGGSYSFVNHVNQSESRAASDHFMQSAVLPVRPGPYGAARSAS